MRLSTLDSTSLILVSMLVASVVAHAGVHYELGQLAKAQALAALARAQAQQRDARRATLEFDLADEPAAASERPVRTPPAADGQPVDITEVSEAPPPQETPDAADAARRAQERARRRAEQETRRRERVAQLETPPEATPEPEPEPEPELLPEPARPAPPPTPPPEDQARIAVRQHSQNPDDPPPDTAFIADENNTVEEETVAEVTNLDRDDAETSVGAAIEPPSEATEERGNADDAQLAESEDVDGSDERRPTPEEVTRRPRDRPITPPRAEGRTTSEAPPDSRASSTPQGDGAGAVARREEAQQGRAGGGSASAGGAPGLLASSQSDWSVQGEGALGVGGRDGAAGVPVPERAGREGEERGSQRGSARSGRRPGERSGRPGPDLTLRFSQLSDIVGEERLTEEREAYFQEQRSRIRGSSSGARWEQFRAALENYMPSVRPGTQTALNAARSPFATYIARMHDRVHQTYHGFVENLPLDPSGPFGDPNLRTLLEIVLNRDGSVHRVGVVRSSGLSMFDYGAYNAVMRGQPYPVAPDAILSGDGRVYMHWDFHREQPYCHQSHARPYLLPNVRGGEDDAPVQRLQDSAVVPSGAQANYGVSGVATDSEDDDDGPDEDDTDQEAAAEPGASGGTGSPPRAATPRSRGPRL
ncbi:MAG: TonB C-terminal domain-containing protein [Sandaracinaceae bacterium]|nr:TonB C-terminal domain-containing protein [Sandaracinaceae bacterium]